LAEQGRGRPSATSSSENYAHNAIGGVPIFAADWSENMTLQFQTDCEGDVASLSIPLEPAVALIFRRMPEPATRTRAFLEPLIGLYRRCGISFRIDLHDADRLTLTRGNGACERLLPCHIGTFTLPHDHYFQLEFRRDTSGAAARCCSMKQPASAWWRLCGNRDSVAS